MTKFIYTGVIALLLLGAAVAPQAYAETTTTQAAMLEQIKTLMAKLQELQKQLATIRGEVQDVIKDGLAEGMTDGDIKEIQELLASDPTLYPEGKVTGYFGPMTKEAVKRFQARHELQVTGVIDSETKTLMEEYFKERYGGKVPPGLMKAPGIMKKVQERFALRCDDKKAMGPFCKKIKDRDRDRDRDGWGDDSDDEDDDSNDDEELEVEIEIEDGYTKVKFEIDDVKYKVVLRSTDEDDVLVAVADKLDVEVSALDADLVAAIKKALADEVENADLDGDFDLEIEVEDGDTKVEFLFDGERYEVTIDNSTKLEDVLDAVADEIKNGDDAGDLDADLKSAIEDMLSDVIVKAEAKDAIDAAEEAIDDARDTIEDASGDTEPADDKADDAEDKLAEAVAEFEDENYDDAKTLADAAKNLANDAVDLLPE